MEELKYFFSYTRTDSEFVLQLAKDLRAVGANLWLDQLDILGGQHWDSTVEQALKSCKGMIAVLSPEAVASENVMDEVSYALDEGKLVVPVLIRACDIPLRLRRVQYIDFTAGYDKGFSQLVRALGIEQPAQPTEPTAAQEPVVPDSTAPLKAKPTEPLAHEKQAPQEVEEPLLPKVSEPTPRAPDHSRPTGVETRKAPSMSQKTKVLAAVCIVALITIVSIVVFLKYRQPKVIADSIGMKLVYIPAGSFEMGSSRSATQLADDYKEILAKLERGEEHFQDEFPQHKVRISEGFWMGQTEVTQGQYKEVMKAKPWLGENNVPKDCVQVDDNNPAVYVTWEDANNFCRVLSNRKGEKYTYRLPTEAEWEYACRAGKTFRFSFGDSSSSLDKYAWYAGNPLAKDERYAHPVRKMDPNPWGLYDMHGNVWEWCNDWYAQAYYSNSPSDDPPGPASGTDRSLRGGAWDCDEDALRCSCRRHVTPDQGSEIIGFRVVRSQ